MWSHVSTCVAGVIDHWVAIVTGSSVSLFILVKEKWSDKPVRWKTILAIFFAGFLISLFFAWQDQYTSAEWRGGEVSRLNGLIQGRDAEITNLRNELMQKDRPVVLQYATDPEITKMLNRQDQELAKLKNSLPSPKKRALQVSNDLLKFLAERNRAQPQFPMPNTTGTKEEFIKQQNAFEQAYVQWMNETSAQAQTRFAIPVAQVLEDMRTENIDAGSGGNLCTLFNGNTYAIQSCATTIGVLAQKLPR